MKINKKKYTLLLSGNSGNVTNLPSVGGTNSKNNAVNDSGTSVGWSRTTGDNGFHATVWIGVDTIDLGAGASGGTSSRATAINNTNLVIVGSSVAADNLTYRATMWTASWNGINATDLGTLGGAGSMAKGVNASNQIVGQADTAYNSKHATLWVNGLATDLGTLSGFNNSQANSINTLGQIVGWSGSHAALWSNGTITDLNSLLSASTLSAGWVLNGANAINDSGSIVGFASNSLLGISSQAFVLAPVPEADTSAMLLMGVGLISFIERRRKQKAA